MGEYTTSLFARPSLFEGAARILDFGNTLHVYNSSSSPSDADYESLVADFEAVARSAREVVAELRREYEAIG